MLGELYEQLFKDYVAVDWAQEIDLWGRRIALYRQYTKGQQRTYLTETMKRMLNLKSDVLEHFSIDYTKKVARKKSERLVVKQIEASETIPTPSPSAMQIPPSVPPATQTPPSVPPATQGEVINAGQMWVDDRLKLNRFDALQIKVHKAESRDGDVFVMVAFDETTMTSRMYYERAYDGDVGMIPVYDRADPDELYAAIKIFYTGKETKQINVYYADHIDKYTMDINGGDLTVVETGIPWIDPVSQKPLGVPVVHFAAEREDGDNVGQSELLKIINLQDMLNRVSVSMVMSCELTGFLLLFAKGFVPPPTIAPGDIITANADGDPSLLQYVDLSSINPGDPQSFIKVLERLVDFIGDISDTPVSGQLGSDSSSGEALKERDKGLLAKVRNAQVILGNSWEDVMSLMHRVESAFATKKPPMIDLFNCHWQDAQVRNDLETFQEANMVYDKLEDKTLYLDMIGDVIDLDASKRQTILDRSQAQANQVLAGLNLPGVGNALNFGANLNGVPGAVAAPSKI